MVCSPSSSANSAPLAHSGDACCGPGSSAADDALLSWAELAGGRLTAWHRPKKNELQAIARATAGQSITVVEEVRNALTWLTLTYLAVLKVSPTQLTTRIFCPFAGLFCVLTGHLLRRPRGSAVEHLCSVECVVA